MSLLTFCLNWWMFSPNGLRIVSKFSLSANVNFWDFSSMTWLAKFWNSGIPASSILQLPVFEIRVFPENLFCELNSVMLLDSCWSWDFVVVDWASVPFQDPVAVVSIAEIRDPVWFGVAHCQNLVLALPFSSEVDPQVTYGPKLNERIYLGPIYFPSEDLVHFLRASSNWLLGTELLV